VDLPKTDAANPVLDILVEGMGHINFAQFMIDRKGITDRVTLNGMTLMNWQTFLLPMTEINNYTATKTIADKNGWFFKGNFTLTETGDTYFDLSKYSKGIVHVNGHNLGRYWNVGPQQHLYCPATWLKKGNNEIIIFDLHQNKAVPVAGVKTLE
ncbi:MAG: beta-galactosidase, partial [Ferruginibacter sp.]